MSRKSASRASEIIGRILFFTLLASMVFSLVRFLTAPEALAPGAEFEKTKSDYLLTLSQCVLGMIVMLLPSLIDRRWKLGIANFIYILYYIFLYCAVFLGEMFDFYYRFPHWDTLLHFFSGAMLDALAALAVSVVGYFTTIRRRESANSERQEAIT